MKSIVSAVFSVDVSNVTLLVQLSFNEAITISPTNTPTIVAASVAAQPVVVYSPDNTGVFI